MTTARMHINFHAQSMLYLVKRGLYVLAGFLRYFMRDKCWNRNVVRQMCLRAFCVGCV